MTLSDIFKRIRKGDLSEPEKQAILDSLQNLPGGIPSATSTPNHVQASFNGMIQGRNYVVSQISNGWVLTVSDSRGYKDTHTHFATFKALERGVAKMVRTELSQFAVAALDTPSQQAQAGVGMQANSYAALQSQENIGMQAGGYMHQQAAQIKKNDQMFAEARRRSILTADIPSTFQGIPRETP